MSLKSNSIKSENKSNTSLQLTDQLSRIRGSVAKSIGEDLNLLKATIDFSQFNHSMPELKKISKNQSINELELKAKMDEINSKVDSLEKSNINIDNENKDLDQFNERCNRLEKLFPTFKRIANTFTEKNQNNDNCLNRKQIEISDQKMDQLVKTGQRIEHFQRSDKYLKALKH